jgi:hypothetical protein
MGGYEYDFYSRVKMMVFRISVTSDIKMRIVRGSQTTC